MSKQPEILILGGGYAGLLVALRLSAKNKNAHITLVNGLAYFVERIRSHQIAANQTLKHRPIARMLQGTSVQFLQGWVKKLMPEQRTVSVQTPQGNQMLRYDTLVYALGSMVDRDSIPGVRDHAYVLNPTGENSASELRGWLAQLAQTGGRVAVIGGGLTGIEGSTEIAEAYPNLQVSFIMAGKVGANLSVKAQNHLRRTFGNMGITVYENTPVKQIEAHAVITQSGKTMPFDVILWGGGFKALPLAREAGLAVNERGQILVDPWLRSISHPEIYAVGDAAYPVERPGAEIRMGCVTAQPMAAHLADNLNAVLHGQAEQPFSFGFFIQCISLGRNKGLVQFVTPDDEPEERILTGWTGAQVKEFICKSTVYTLHMERRLPGSTLWMPYPDKAKVAHELSDQTRQLA